MTDKLSSNTPQREYKVRASSMTATYNAGRFVASSAAEACQMARDDYARSSLGRSMNDVRAFRFYTVDKFPHEEES
jgi:1,2-phenylacetyl-CoA epoxidase PaaB subunit